MPRRVIPSIKADFEGVVSLLVDRGLIPESRPGGMLAIAERIHRSTYSLLLWRFRLRNIPIHGKVFVEEIASDALQILPQTLAGYEKTTKLLIRGIIENTLRHVYFSDHRIEFQRMNSDSKWYMTTDALFEYLRMHPIYSKTEPQFDGVNRLSSLYHELSASVHGRTVRDLEMRVALDKIAYVERRARKTADQIEKCTQGVNFVLGMFHREQVREFRADDRRAILLATPPQARRVWNEAMLD